MILLDPDIAVLVCHIFLEQFCCHLFGKSPDPISDKGFQEKYKNFPLSPPQAAVSQFETAGDREKP
jgi:hypothetical protein